MLGTTQLLLCCFAGTLLDNKHDKLIECTYDICWYNMKIKDQKKLGFLLQATQKEVSVEYLFGVLNIPLFVEIYKKIYSGLTMMIQMKNEYFYSKTCELLKKWSYFVGLDVIKENYSPVNTRLFLLVLFNSSLIVFNITSLYERRSLGIVEISLSCIPLGTLFQGIAKQLTFCLNHTDMKNLVDSGAMFYNSLKYDKMKGKARDYAFFGYMVFNHFIRYAYIFAVLVVLLTPMIYVNFFGAEKILAYEVNIPLIDAKSDYGYWINFANHSVASAYYIIGLVAGDGIYIMLLTNAFTQLENIYFELENLDSLTRKSNKKMKKQKVRDQIKDQTKTQVEQKDIDKEISEKLNHIIELHQNYLSFIKQVNEIFLGLFTVNVFTMVFQIVVSLFIVVVSVGTILSAPIFALLGSTQLLLSCTVGTLLDKKHDKLIECTYDICWYNMKVEEQKKVKFLLQATQQEVFIGYAFGALNIPLFVEIYKKIYSGLTMLMQKKNSV
ncbi:uncharacterized protein LOC134837893 [Culicoides brevitarsis]|uniref:uncharacterized protein LOC134837893 n=1 Tax=Culicoides brevitarsis TaxID=469753 RepID=UPI00307B7AEA